MTDIEHILKTLIGRTEKISGVEQWLVSLFSMAMTDRAARGETLLDIQILPCTLGLHNVSPEGMSN